MIKVCFIISGFAYSGAEIVLNRYLKNNTTIDPYFVILYNKLDIVEKFKEIYGEDNVYCLNIKHNKNTLRFIPWIDINKVNLNIDKFISEIRPNVIYCNNTVETMLVSKYIKKSNIPSIAHIHDMKKSIKSIIRRVYTKYSLKFYDKLIMVSNATKVQWGIDDSVVIYNGLEKDYFKIEKKEYKNIKNIGVVGTLSKRKGTDLLLKSIDELVKMDIKIHIVYNHGDDKFIEHIKKKSKEYKKNIFIYKNLNSSQIKDFYDCMDLILTPSRQDPLPTVVIESMARRTIAIGSDVDGIPEMIKQKELLINIKSEKDIISKIKEIKLFSSEELNELSENQFKYCKDNFSSSNKNNKINQIINELLNINIK